MLTDSIISFAIETTTQLIIQEAQFLYGVKDQVKQLQDELQRMRCFLQDAEKKQYENERVRHWISEIREAAYDAEDLIEDFVLKIELKKQEGVIGAIIRVVGILSEAVNLHIIGSEIVAITTRLSSISAAMQDYGIQEAMDKEQPESSHAKVKDKRRSFAHAVERDLVGLERSTEELVSALVDEEKKIRVLSICGMGGLGKTTLARQVYHHKKVRKHFDGFAWAYVSQQCQRRDVWEGIMLSLSYKHNGTARSGIQRSESGICVQRAQSDICVQRPQSGIHINFLEYTQTPILNSQKNKPNIDQIMKMGDEELVEELHEFLKNNKCLVVLDDIWCSEDWISLKDAFPYESGSRIILTSRNKDVASYTNRDGLLHQPACLNDDQSWELLQKIAFPKMNNPGDSLSLSRSIFLALLRIKAYQSHVWSFNVSLDIFYASASLWCKFFTSRVEKKMELLGKQMIKHCAGLPLAIRVLGGILAKKCTPSQWQMIHENVKSHIMGGVGQTSNNSSVNGIFSLSYEELPSQLKKCFLYLAQFPEDYEISVDKLLKFWSAEGMITLTSEGENIMVEDVAECYLDELIERSMVLVGVRDVVSSRVRTCRLHDLMRDLCLLKAEQENFVKVIDPQIHDVHADSLSSLSTSKFRRVAIHLFRAKGERRFVQNDIKNRRLRSLIYFNTTANYISGDNMNWELFKPSFKEFNFLRVLDLEDANLKGGKVPKDIGKLIHLRFLSFQFAGVSSFPSSLGNLRMMETLDLRVFDAYIPDVLWKMKKLRHLYLPPTCDAKTKLQLRNLVELRTLVHFPLGVCDVNDLFSLTKLQILTVHRTSQMKAFEAPILPASISASLEQLESLSLGGSEAFGVIEDDLVPSPPAADISSLLTGFTNLLDLVLYLKITRLPSLAMIPSTITSITLGSCKLEKDPMQVLGRLSELRSLSIQFDGYIGKKMICKETGFPKLILLFIFLPDNLEEWKLEKGSMPCLSMLNIGVCKNLKKLPEALSGINTLQELEIYMMPKNFKDRLVPGGCDFYKIQHVSSVVFQQCDGDEDS